MPTGQCLLCGQASDLQLSHVLPAFVFRWLRESAGNGHLRTVLQPNRRVQDGEKRYWLCSSCETMLGKSERLFASEIFHPYLEHSGKRLPYGRWMMLFCTSLSWRVLRFYMETKAFSDLPPETVDKMMAAESVWREVLLGKRPHPGKHHQHLICTDSIDAVHGKFPPNFSRYLTRAVQMDLCLTSTTIFTYAKIGRFIVLGFVVQSQPSRWSGSKVNANQGTVEPRTYILPAAFGDYLKSKANRVRKALGSMSEQQQHKVDETFRKNADRFSGSDADDALQADLRLFGDDAFLKEGRPDK